ncbi:MAG: aspartyl protease family protein, partial [Gemmatimonadetes bacterium]|nr:aspartyl protease family protein [Gemmatimonadota bacterium]
MNVKRWTVGAALALALGSTYTAGAQVPGTQSPPAHAFRPDSATARSNARQPPTAPPRAVDLPEGGAEVPLTMQNRRPLVEVRVNGSGPYRFIVETGAPFTAVTPEVAAALGLVAADTANPVVAVDSLGIGAAELRGMRVSVFRVGLPGVDGVLGLNAYRDLLLTLDYGASRMRLERGSLPAANGRDRLALFPVGRLWGFTIEVNGKRAPAVLDTQSEGGFSVTPESAAGVAFVRAPVVTGISQGPGIGVQETRTARLDGDVRVGDVPFRRPLVGVVPMPSGYPKDWNVGSRVLREFTVTLDQRHRVLRLERPGRAEVAPPPALRSMGFRSQVRQGKRVVLDVVPGSEAERAGIRAGDEVVSLDGGPATALVGAAWNDRAQAGAPLTLVLRRDGAE